MKAQKLDFVAREKQRLRKRREAHRVDGSSPRRVRLFTEAVELLAAGRGPPLFLCKCSFCKSCTRGLHKLAADDWERFWGGEYLTQSAQRHGDHGEKRDGLKVWCSADDLFELADSDWPGCEVVIFLVRP
jgi:hypothetical protein